MDDDYIITIKNARCIIIWGTKEHLAELVDGPTNRTKLGRTHDFSVMATQVIGFYVVNEEAWKTHLVE